MYNIQCSIQQTELFFTPYELRSLGLGNILATGCSADTQLFIYLLGANKLGFDVKTDGDAAGSFWSQVCLPWRFPT